LLLSRAQPPECTRRCSLRNQRAGISWWSLSTYLLSADLPRRPRIDRRPAAAALRSLFSATRVAHNCASRRTFSRSMSA
jgi:hypothetical protein